jgi:hypothetical protein
MKTLFKSNLWGLGLLIGLSFLLIYITGKYILSVGFYNNSGDIFSGLPDQNTAVFDALQRWIYITEVLYTVVKVNVITLILYTALFLSDQKVSYNRVLNIVIYCEYVFLIPAAIKIPWFLDKYPNGTVSDWHKTYIFSALSLFEDVPADWYYPLQTLNIFEVLYWFLLAYGISKITALDFDNSLRTVLVSYLPALMIWIATVCFCTLTLFPTYG